MRKIFLTLLILLLPIRICSAQSVPLTDSSLEDFVSRCNQIFLEIELQPLEFDSTEEVGGLTQYVHSRGNSQTIFDVNSRGAIERITIVFSNNLDSSADIGFESVSVILFALGLSESEIDALFAGDNPTSVWCSELQRQIVLEGSTDSEGFGFITIEARDL